MGWKIYFWIFSLFLIIAYGILFTYAPTIWEVIDLIISTVALVGLYLYAYKKKLLNPKFWASWLSLLITWDLIYNLLLSEYLGIAQKFEGSEEGTITELVISWLFILPEYIALYLLSFKSENLWKK